MKINEKTPAIIILPEPEESGSKSPRDSEMNRKVEPKQTAIISKSAILIVNGTFILVFKNWRLAISNKV